MAAFAAAYAYGPTRVQFENKDPRGFAEFKAMLAEHSAKGSANTQLGVQRERPSVFELEEGLRKLTVPMLVVTGDEDWALPAARRVHQAHLPLGGAARHPQQRPCHQYRGARGLQRRRRRLPGAGRCGTLAHARSARHQPKHHRHEQIAWPHAETNAIGDNAKEHRQRRRPVERIARIADVIEQSGAANEALGQLAPRSSTSCMSSAFSACSCRAPTMATRSTSAPGSAPWRRWASSTPARPGASAR